MDTSNAAGSARDIVVPEGSRVVHIGPPKTATTAIQAAFHLARATCEAQGVHYAGFARHSATEVRAAIGLPSPWSQDERPPNIVFWKRLAREVRLSSASRVVLSSEEFAVADEATIRRVVDDLGGRVHVVVTLRPIARLLPSQWQQYVRNRLTTPFDEWLETTLRAWDDPPGTKTDSAGRERGFWSRHRHHELVRRWADVVGPEQLTVIVVDDRDRSQLFRVFERLVGLREGSLVPDPEITNRSLTLPELEIIRAFNATARANHLSRPLYTRVMRRGAALLLERRRPPADETPVLLPPGSLQRIVAISREIVAGIAGSGVRIVGDLDRLTEAGTTRGDGPQEVVVTPELAALAAFDVLVATGAVRGIGAEPAIGISKGYSEPPELFRLSTPQLALALLRRSAAAVTGRVRAIRPGRGLRVLSGRAMGTAAGAAAADHASTAPALESGDP